MFEPSLDVDKPNDDDEDMQNRCIEGIRLARMTLVNVNRINKEAFSEYFMLFAKRHNFTPTMSAFVNISHGPEWFTRKFPATGEQENVSREVWEDFLTPKLLSTIIGISKESAKILCY